MDPQLLIACDAAIRSCHPYDGPTEQGRAHERGVWLSEFEDAARRSGCCLVMPSDRESLRQQANASFNARAHERRRLDNETACALLEAHANPSLDAALLLLGAQADLSKGATDAVLQLGSPRAGAGYWGPWDEAQSRSWYVQRIAAMRYVVRRLPDAWRRAIGRNTTDLALGAYGQNEPLRRMLADASALDMLGASDAQAVRARKSDTDLAVFAIVRQLA